LPVGLHPIDVEPVLVGAGQHQRVDLITAGGGGLGAIGAPVPADARNLRGHRRLEPHLGRRQPWRSGGPRPLERVGHGVEQSDELGREVRCDAGQIGHGVSVVDPDPVRAPSVKVASFMTVLSARAPSRP
jgi:hypothetical protein